MSVPTDLLERFAHGPALLAGVLTGLADGEADFVPGPGKWTIRQLAAHLADSELVTGMRYRQVVAEQNPPLPGYDQELWASRLDYAWREPEAALATFRQLRAESARLLQAQPAEAWERTGMHSERGPQTLLRLVETYTVHTERHAEQIRGIRASFAAKGASA